MLCRCSCRFVFVFAVTFAATTISTSINTGGTLTVTDTSTLTGAVTTGAAATVGTDLTVTSGARIGTGSLGGHITALADDSLLIEGQSEFDGISWFDASLRASSTLMVTDAATLYSTLNVTGLTTLANASTTNVSASNALWVGGNATTTSTGAISTQSTLSVTSLATLLGGATTTILTLLNGEIISNATDGIIQLGGVASTTSITLLNGETITNATDGTITLTAATTSFSGLGLLANGFLSQASSTVVGNLTVTGTFSPTQTAATSFLVGGGYGDTGVTLSAAGAISADGLATLAGGATTTTLTLLNGEIISNGTDGVIQLGGVASTTSITLLNGETITNATDGTIALTGALTVSRSVHLYRPWHLPRRSHHHDFDLA